MVYKKAFTLTSLKLRRVKPALPAFTIGELLVVIVVIGILAAITVVSYSGVTSRAILASMQSDLNNASRQLSIFQVEYDSFPNTIDCNIPDSPTNKCLESSDNNSYSFYVNNSSIDGYFCLTTVNGDSSYSIDSSGLSAPFMYCPVLHLDANNLDSYPGSGNTWRDLSSNNNDITLYNGVVFDSSNGGSLNFDGVNDWASINGFKSNITTAFTVSAWMKFDKYAYMDILQMQGTSAFKWRISGQNTYWNIYNSSGWDNSLSYLMAPNINEWHCYTFTYDGTDEKIYLDGVLKNQFTKNITLATPTNFILAPSGGEMLDGAISSVSIYNRALSNTEISTVFNALRGRYGL
ncbi:MAG: LamG-like jellyroll fold domain-containing protein [Candidatus Saccharimonadales bacterium]